MGTFFTLNMGKGPEVRAAHPRPSQSRVPPPPDFDLVGSHETRNKFKLYIFLDFYLFCNYFYLIFDVQSKIQNNSYWKCNKLLLVLN